MAKRRARGEEYARRVNHAAALLAQGRPPTAVRRALQAQYALSERQALRYVRAAEASPGGVAVPEPTATFTVRLPVSVIARARGAAAARGLGIGALTARALRTDLDQEGGEEGGMAS